MQTAFEFTLNGKLVRVEAISPNMTLLEFLRGSGHGPLVAKGTPD